MFRIASLLLLVSLLTGIGAAQAATRTTKTNKPRTRTALVLTPAADAPMAPAISPEAQLARQYSPIQYCHGVSYPVTTWMQVRDFQDKHSPAAVATKAGSKPPVTTDPSLTTIPKLEYPEAMRASGLNGAVAVMVAVTKEGLPSDVLVVCSNHPAFSEAALLAVKAATFAAATRNGQPIESVATLPIDFHP